MLTVILTRARTGFRRTDTVCASTRTVRSGLLDRIRQIINRLIRGAVRAFPSPPPAAVSRCTCRDGPPRLARVARDGRSLHPLAAHEPLRPLRDVSRTHLLQRGRFRLRWRSLRPDTPQTLMDTLMARETIRTSPIASNILETSVSLVSAAILRSHMLLTSAEPVDVG